MKEYVEDLPAWMLLLYDTAIEAAHHELQEQSKAYQYYKKLSGKIQDKDAPIYSDKPVDGPDDAVALMAEQGRNIVF